MHDHLRLRPALDARRSRKGSSDVSKKSNPTPYQVLARKYRPAAFEQVIGQEGVVSTLTNAIRLERLHHAYLFSGTRGVGKTTLARLFARALNCAKGPTVTPCGVCDACREIAAGSSMDVIEIDGASNRKVEDVDPLREAARYAPARDRHKIFIIDEVHMLSDTAFNALLKILEEPPPRTIFLFATTEPEEVPDTILSRCLHLACRRVPRRQIAEALERTAAAESTEGTKEAFDLIAGLADGSVRDGLSLLDQAIAFAGGNVNAQTVRESLGLIDRGVVSDFIGAIGAGDGPAVLAVIERLSASGADLTHFSREALARVRDLLVVRTAGVAGSEALGFSKEEAAALAALADRFTADGLLRLTQALLDLCDKIRRAEQPRYLLEAAALRMIHLADLTPIQELLRLLTDQTPPAPSQGGRGTAASSPSSSRGSASGGTRGSGLPFDAMAMAEPPGTTELIETSAPAQPRTMEDTPLAQGAAATPEGGFASLLLERVTARKVSLGTFLQQAPRIAIDGETVVISVSQRQGFLMTALQTPENLALLQEEAAALAGRPLKVAVRLEAPVSDNLAAIAGQDASGDGPSRRDRLVEEALKEPVVQSVMDLFKGRIVDIREAR